MSHVHSIWWRLRVFAAVVLMLGSPVALAAYAVWARSIPAMILLALMPLLGQVWASVEEHRHPDGF